MERRWGIRKNVEVDVVIDNQPVGLLCGRIDNVSVGGLFVQTESKNLSKNSPIELVILLQQESGTRVYRLPAMVVRLSRQGAGLMLNQYDVTAFRALVMLLLAQQKAYLAGKALTASTISQDGGNDAASMREGARNGTAKAAGPLTSTSHPSPAYGE